MTNTSEPKPANSLTPCPFGGNPKVAAQMGFPSCGIARPGPFFNDLNLGKSISGGRKSRRGGRKSRRGGINSGDQASSELPSADVAPVQVPVTNKQPVQVPVTNKQPVAQQQCPQECIAKGCGKRNFLHKLFGSVGGRKSRRGGRKSRRGGRKSRRGGRKSRRGGRKSRR
tara:strand:- start:15059 stop:15568 length:510 start_codon:yes stop_codon:yes gene_type:complete